MMVRCQSRCSLQSCYTQMLVCMGVAGLLCAACIILPVVGDHRGRAGAVTTSRPCAPTCVHAMLHVGIVMMVARRGIRPVHWPMIDHSLFGHVLSNG